MIHYVLLKFYPDTFTDEILCLAQNTFSDLEKELSCIRKAEVFINCITRDANADLLIRLDLTSQDALPVYLNHPLHRSFAQVTSPIVAQRVSFDHC